MFKKFLFECPVGAFLPVVFESITGLAIVEKSDLEQTRVTEAQ